MRMRLWIGCALLAALALAVAQADACSYCDPALKRRLTLREDHALAKFVVVCTVGEVRIEPDMSARTDLAIDAVLKQDPAVKQLGKVTLPRYIPSDPKSPAKLIIFADLFNGKPDYYRGIPIQDPRLVEYFRKVAALGERPPEQLLGFYLDYLDSPVAEVAADAFLEFAKASDPHVIAAARAADPRRFRALLLEPRTPPERLSLYAFLLGCCGVAEDAKLFRDLLARQDDRTQASIGGLLSGLIELKPEEGWALTGKIIADTARPFAHRLAALNTVRFYQASNPAGSRSRVLAAVRGVLLDGEFADMVIEDLRRWGWWDESATILEQAGKASHAAPIVQRAIVRYALCCPEKVCQSWVTTARKNQPELVREVEQGLELEQPTREKK